MSENLKPTILVAEDDRSWQRLFQVMLEDEYRVVMVANLQEALRELEENSKVDAVLSDGLGFGYQVLIRLAIEKKIPIVVASADPDKVNNAIQMGAKGWEKNGPERAGVLMERIELSLLGK